MGDDFRSTLDTYARRYGLSPTQRLLLEQTAKGLSGLELATALRVTPKELGVLEKLFKARTGRLPVQAAAEIHGIVRHRSSRPPSVRQKRPVSGVATRPGVKVRRTGSEDE